MKDSKTVDFNHPEIMNIENYQMPINMGLNLMFEGQETQDICIRYDGHTPMKNHLTKNFFKGNQTIEAHLEAGINN
jgi:hypothetical protein